MILFNGQIIASKKNLENEIIKFDQLNIDLSNLSTTTIKKPKIQETSTIKLFSCLRPSISQNNFCNEGFKKEILPTLNRRIIVPFYIPVLSLICALLLIKEKNFFLNKTTIFLYGFSLLLFIELAIRYTGINNTIMYLFLGTPLATFLLLYIYLIINFSRENNKHE